MVEMSIERGVNFLQFLIYEQHEMDGDCRPVGGDVGGDQLVETGWRRPVGGDQFPFRFGPHDSSRTKTASVSPRRNPPKPPAHDDKNTMASAPLSFPTWSWNVPIAVPQHCQALSNNRRAAIGSREFSPSMLRQTDVQKPSILNFNLTMSGFLESRQRFCFKTA
jgi:hypothetical protein